VSTNQAGERPLSNSKIAQIESSFAQQGLLQNFKARIQALSSGRCTIELPYSQGVTQQQGFFHGGVIGALGDSAGGYAAMTLTPDGAEVLTMEYKINFLRPAVGDRLVAEGEVLRAGRSVSVTRVDVYAERDGKRVLCAALQQSIVPVQAETPPS